jgi:pentatricopeptide repeat protein
VLFRSGLMRCYQRLGRHTEAISVYRRLRQTLSVVLSVSPSPESRALYRTIMEVCAGRPEATEEQTVVALRTPGRVGSAGPARRRSRG